MKVTEVERKESTKHCCGNGWTQKNSAEHEGYAGALIGKRIAENNTTNADRGVNGLLERIVEAGNLNRAYKRVKRNKGAGGVDGMKVDELLQYLKDNGKEIRESIVDGPGLRFTVFTQGCPHRCPGCHNPGTHDPAGGREVSVAELAAELSGNPLTDGLTLSGGEPFCQAAECAALARIARERGLNVWAYTGYTYERLLAGEVPDALALLEQVDVLVDGPFVEAEKSYAALFRGSANQRLIDVPKSLAAGAVVLWERPDPLAHFTRPES